jgi:hypothetical protein
MKTVLFIDYIYQKGHINFNKIHIESLIKSGFDVKLVLHKKVAEQLPYSTAQYALVLPNWLCQKEKKPILNRLFFLIALLLIKIKINCNKYDYLVISSFEEITLGLFPPAHKMFIICHGNIENVYNKTKKIFLKKLSKKNVFVVFNNYIRNEYIKHGFNNVKIISHGCIKKATIEKNEKKDSFVIFQPSDKLNDDFANNIIKNKSFHIFIKKNNIKLILKSKKTYHSPCNNIEFINHFLTEQEYNNIFQYADAILIAYPNNFNYRVSGVSYECISYDKRILVLQNNALNYCKDYYNYNPMFRSIKELSNTIELLIHNSNKKCIANIEILKPDYNSIFKSCNFQ